VKSPASWPSQYDDTSQPATVSTLRSLVTRSVTTPSVSSDTTGK
jgi:hypothetical protein